MKLIDLKNVKASPVIPRKEVDVKELSDTGKECLQRAIIEFERRFAGNKTDSPLTEEKEGL